MNDKFNERILCELTKDGRLSNVDLAERVGLSPSACLRRVQALEANGSIAGYRAVLDPVANGVGFIAYIAIGLSNHSTASQIAFEQAVEACQEIRECHNVTGTIEYLLRVEVSDLAAYKQLHAEVLGALPQIATITTYVVMASPKNERG